MGAGAQVRFRVTVDAVPFGTDISNAATVDFVGVTFPAPFTATSDPASVTVENQSPTIAVAASADPDPVTGTTTALSVLGADDAGEGALVYTWTASGPAAVTFGPNGTNGAKASTATFAAAGTYVLTVTVTDGDGASVTSAVTVVVEQTPTAIEVSPPSATVDRNGTQSYTATVTDQFGAPIPSPPVVWSVDGGGTIDGSGLFTAGSVAGGPFTVTATYAGLSDTATVTVANAPPTVAVAASAAPVTGTGTTASVLGADDAGEEGLSYTWSGSGPAAVAFGPNGTNGAKATAVTFNAAGTYVLTVTITDADGLTATSSTTVIVPQTATTIVVTPAAASIGRRATQAYTATVSDQFGNPIAAPAVVWSVSGGGTIDAGGVFIAGDVVGGPHTVTATSGDAVGHALVTVIDAPPVVVVPPAAESLDGRTVALRVLGDDDGSEANLVYTWSATGPGPVTFSPNGTNDAKNTVATLTVPGVYVFTVTITDASGNSVTATVVIGGALIDDTDLLVRVARFQVRWPAHDRARPADRLTLRGRLNPRGLPADLAGTQLELRVGDRRFGPVTLDTAGRYRTPAGGKPRLRARLLTDSGRFRIRLTKADLVAALGLERGSGSAALTVPVTLTVSSAATPTAGNRLRFAVVSRAGDRRHLPHRSPGAPRR